MENTRESYNVKNNTVNRKYKDRLFRMVFSQKKELLELYNALNETNYDDPQKLEINTLENAIYMSMRNDISFLIDSSIQTLYPLFARAHKPQTMTFSCFAALSSIGVRPVRLNRLPCKARKSPWLRSQSRKEINFVPCKALE